MSAPTITDVRNLTGDYVLDQTHSRIGFAARHVMVTKVKGEFHEFEGRAHIDGADPTRSNAQLTIKAVSINTRNEQRDAHLRSNDFLAIDEYPEIWFESTSVERVAEDTFRVTGDLTLKGVTKPVDIAFQFTGAATDPYGNFRVGFEGSTTINRRDWGVNWNAMLEGGGVMVSEKVTLEFDVSAIRVD